MFQNKNLGIVNSFKGGELLIHRAVMVMNCYFKSLLTLNSILRKFENPVVISSALSFKNSTSFSLVPTSFLFYSV